MQGDVDSDESDNDGDSVQPQLGDGPATADAAALRTAALGSEGAAAAEDRDTTAVLSNIPVGVPQRPADSLEELEADPAIVSYESSVPQSAVEEQLNTLNAKIAEIRKSEDAYKTQLQTMQDNERRLNAQQKIVQMMEEQRATLMVRPRRASGSPHPARPLLIARTSAPSASVSVSGSRWLPS